MQNKARIKTKTRETKTRRNWKYWRRNWKNNHISTIITSLLGVLNCFYYSINILLEDLYWICVLCSPLLNIYKPTFEMKYLTYVVFLHSPWSYLFIYFKDYSDFYVDHESTPYDLYTIFSCIYNHISCMKWYNVFVWTDLVIIHSWIIQATLKSNIII